MKKHTGGFSFQPQPSILPDVESTLRNIAKCKHIIVTDLTNDFYQVPLSRQSMKYCGVATPFRGVRVYARSAMGMPGSETALEELMFRVVGELLEESILTKIADDLYCGGDTPYKRLHNLVLQALEKCDLNLAAHKTVICARTAMIVGWNWCLGTIRAIVQCIATLSTCSPPDKVQNMGSFFGAYSVIKSST